MSDPISSAVVSEVVSRSTSFLTCKCSEYKSINERIDRLEMLHIKIKSVVEVSETFDINIKSLQEWQDKLKEVLCEADEMLSILRGKPNRTVEGGSTTHDQSIQEEGSHDATLVHPASNLREAVTRQVNLEANIPHDQSMQEEGSHDATLVHPASNLRDAVTCQVELEANKSHDQSIQEEGSHDSTLVHPASHLRDVVTHQVILEENIFNDQWMQEEGSHDSTLVHPASHLREVVTHQVVLEANISHHQSMQEGSHDSTLVHPASHVRETVTCQVNLEPNISQDQSMQEEGSHDSTLVHPASNLREGVTPQVGSELRMLPLPLLPISWYSMPRLLSIFMAGRFDPCISMLDYMRFLLQTTDSPWPAIIKRLSAFARVLDPRTFSLQNPRMMFDKYLENNEKVSKLIKTVEKLEKTAGDIGDFIKLLELQSKRKMCRKRKRSGVALQGFFLVYSLKLQTYAIGKILISLLRSCSGQTAIYLLETQVIFSSDTSCEVFGLVSIYCKLDHQA